MNAHIETNPVIDPSGIPYGPENCPIRSAIDAIGDDKWKLTVFLEIARTGVLRFRAMLRAIPMIRTKALSKALRALEEDGLVDRRSYDELPLRVEYRLTARAAALIPILLQLQEWYGAPRLRALPAPRD